MSDADNEDTIWRRQVAARDDGYGLNAAKRLGLRWSSWMGDWFVAHSPRNDSTCGEGPWEHWVTLAQQIINDPLTELVRPDVYQAVPAPTEQYSGADRYVTDTELRHRFESDETL